MHSVDPWVDGQGLTLGLWPQLPPPPRMPPGKSARRTPSCSAHWDGIRKTVGPRASELNLPGASAWRPSPRDPREPRNRNTITEGTIMDAKTGSNTKSGKLTIDEK